MNAHISRSPWPDEAHHHPGASHDPLTTSPTRRHRRPTRSRRPRPARRRVGVGPAAPLVRPAGPAAAAPAARAGPGEPVGANLLRAVPQRCLLVRGPRARSTSTGTWGFTPLTNTVCTGGGRFGATTGPMTCADSPARQPQTTIQVPGGGWLKQGYTDLSLAEYTRTIRCPTSPARPGHQAQLRRHQPPRHALGRRSRGGLAGHLLHLVGLRHQRLREAGTTHRVQLLVARAQGPGRTRRSLRRRRGCLVVRRRRAGHLPVRRPRGVPVRLRLRHRRAHLGREAPADLRRLRLQRDRSPQDVVLGGSGSWNRRSGSTPPSPTTVRVPAGTTKVTVGPLDWRAGSDSYWLPNVPYRAGYRAQLHDLSVTLKAAGAVAHVASVRRSASGSARSRRSATTTSSTASGSTSAATACRARTTTTSTSTARATPSTRSPGSSSRRRQRGLAEGGTNTTCGSTTAGSASTRCPARRTCSTSPTSTA